MGCVLPYPDCIQTCCTAPISLTSKTDDNIEDHSRTVLVKVALKDNLQTSFCRASCKEYRRLLPSGREKQKTSKNQSKTNSNKYMQNCKYESLPPLFSAEQRSKHESNEVTGVTLHAALNLTWKVHSLYHLPRFPSHPRLCDPPIPILNVQLLARDEYCASWALLQHFALGSNLIFLSDFSSMETRPSKKYPLQAT